VFSLPKLQELFEFYVIKMSFNLLSFPLGQNHIGDEKLYNPFFTSKLYP
jgi:hypothetical protein